MARPLKFTSGSPSTLQEFSDSEMEYMVYILQLAYADQLNSGGKGQIYQGSGGTQINSVTVTDTESNINTASAGAPSVDGVNQSYPAAPNLVVNASGTFTYGQDRTIPSYPSAADIDSKGFVILDLNTSLTAGNNNLKVPADDAAWGAANGVIQEAITQISTGNEVGSYRVGTSAPVSGGAGVWTDKGTFFMDNRYGSSDQNYKLWLKTSLNVPPGSSTHEPVGITGSADGELRSRATNSTLLGLYADVLLPILTRRLDDGDLVYTVDNSSGSNNRGVFHDSRFTSSTPSQFTNNQGGFSEVYYTRSTPNTSSTAAEVSSYYLNMSG